MQRIWLPVEKSPLYVWKLDCTYQLGTFHLPITETLTPLHPPKKCLLVFFSLFSVTHSAGLNAGLKSAYPTNTHTHTGRGTEHVVTLYRDTFCTAPQTVFKHLAMRCVPITVPTMCWTAGQHVTCSATCIACPDTCGLRGASKFLCAVCWSGRRNKVGCTPRFHLVVYCRKVVQYTDTHLC